MAKELTTEELLELLNEDFDTIMAKLMGGLEKSITEVRPSEIHKIGDYEIREELLHKHALLTKIYVDPFKKRFSAKMSNINKQSYTYDLGDVSIIDSMRKYMKMLLAYGYTKEQLYNLIPCSEEDANILLEAFENGYYDTKFLDNKRRVNIAAKFNEVAKAYESSKDAEKAANLEEAGTRGR